MPGRFYFSIFADYFQLILSDEDTEMPLPEWDDQALAARTVALDTTIYVATARNMSVPVVIELVDKLPARSTESLDSWDHVVECSMRVLSGRLVVMGNSDYYPEAPRVSMIPGVYQVRIYHGGLQTLSEDGLSGSDVYMIMMGQGPVVNVTALKQAPPPGSW